MNRWLFAAALLSSFPISAQVHSQTRPTRIFVQANDIDCESGRFLARAKRLLMNRGFEVVEKANFADFVLVTDIQHGLRPIELHGASLDVVVGQPTHKPFTTTTTWRAQTTDGMQEEAFKTVLKNIGEFGNEGRKLSIKAVEGVSLEPLAKELQRSGYSIVEDAADLTLEVHLSVKPITEDEDFATGRFELRLPSNQVIGRDQKTVTDPHIYEVPVDVVSLLASEIIRTIPAKLPRR
jgi:hypothetical protein